MNPLIFTPNTRIHFACPDPVREYSMSVVASGRSLAVWPGEVMKLTVWTYQNRILLVRKS